MKIVNNNYNVKTSFKSNETNSKRKTIPASKKVAGTVVGFFTLAGVSLLNPSLLNINKIAKLNKALGTSEVAEVRNSYNKVLEQTHLSEKGVHISDRFFKIIEKKYRDMKKVCNNFPKMTKIIEIFEKIENTNAFFISTNKSIQLNDKLPLAFFHEAGHAANYLTNPVTKGLFYLRNLKFAACPITLISLIKSKKTSEDKTDSKLSKILSFTKENSGKLLFASYIPILAEEGIATIRGNGYAKRNLSKELAGKVAKNNRVAYFTYITMAVLPSIALSVATKVKDAITKPAVND